MIDIHVHLRDGNQAAKETIAHGMAIGSQCGIQAFFDMPNTDPALTNPFALRQRIAFGIRQAEEIGQSTSQPLFYGVYGGLTGDVEQVTAMVEAYRSLRPHMVGFKLFAGHSTGNMGLVTFEGQLQLYRTLTRCGFDGVLAVHCEKEQSLKSDRWDPLRPWTHSIARGPEAEADSVADQLQALRISGFAGHLHICHISTAAAIDMVAAGRQAGLRISCGATAHHALLDCSAAGQSWNLLKMNPPLRPQSDRDAVFSALMDGKIDWIESDHAPHALNDKIAGASGIPGFAGTLLLIQALRRAGITPSRLEGLCYRRACEVFAVQHDCSYIPDGKHIEEVLPRARSAYGWDPFAFTGAPTV